MYAIIIRTCGNSSKTTLHNLGKLQGKIDGISYSHTFILFFSDSTEHYGKDIVLVTAATRPEGINKSQLKKTTLKKCRLYKVQVKIGRELMSVFSRQLSPIQAQHAFEALDLSLSQKMFSIFRRNFGNYSKTQARQTTTLQRNIFEIHNHINSLRCFQTLQKTMGKITILRTLPDALKV